MAYSRQTSKRTLKSRAIIKMNPELRETIFLAIKHKPWAGLAKTLSAPTRAKVSLNLSEIDSKTKAGDTVVVPGKILSLGDLTKKVKICALSISANAKTKLKATKSEFATVKSEIKSNPKAEGIKILQ